MNDVTITIPCSRCETGTVKILELYVDCGVPFLCADCTGVHKRPIKFYQDVDSGKHRSLSADKDCPACKGTFPREVYGITAKGATRTYCPVCYQKRVDVECAKAKAKRKQARIERELDGVA